LVLPRSSKNTWPFRQSSCVPRHANPRTQHTPRHPLNQAEEGKEEERETRGVHLPHLGMYGRDLAVLGQAHAPLLEPLPRGPTHHELPLSLPPRMRDTLVSQVSGNPCEPHVAVLTSVSSRVKRHSEYGPSFATSVMVDNWLALASARERSPSRQPYCSEACCLSAYAHAGAGQSTEG
jgi:hypothetical protein